MKATRTKTSWRVEYDETPKSDARRCDHPGCTAGGEFRAPVSRDRLNEYYWFCLDHVRAYNAAWDFYKGMSQEQIEDEIRRSTTWQRQTWPLGQKTSNRRFNFGIHDPFGVFGDEDGEGEAARTRPLTAEEQALSVLELDGPLTLSILKARYKELVKRHHPDANGGDKGAEEKFKEIHQAYTTLLASLNA
jgi:DnaJ-class molecular chaperone with C-terminal Zn finger domain